MRVLITGAAGQLGRELVEAFAGHELVTPDLPALDVSDRAQVEQAVATSRPEVIVHAAAWTDVDGCEGDPDRAFQVNALGTRHVVSAAGRVGARVYYVSTDYVFDGTAGRPYTEWDIPNPISVYGRSKLGGERELRPDDAVVRTSWLCGRHGHNFVKTVITRATSGDELRIVDDQYGCFTSASDLAAMIRLLVDEQRVGVHHVTNQGPTSWYGLACEVLTVAGLDSSVIQPITTAELKPPRPAARPAYAVLDNAALRLSGTTLLPDRHDALMRLVPQLSLDGAPVR